MNTRLAVATHILTFLAFRQGRPASSEMIARSVNTNASLVRRMLSQLSRAGLTRSSKGSAGGAELARDPATITLLDVYGAVDDDRGIFGLHPSPNPLCPVGRNIAAALQPHLDRSESSMLRQLEGTTIAALAAIVTLNSATSSSPAGGH